MSSGSVSNVSESLQGAEVASTLELVALSSLFAVIGVTGMVGNALVMVAILGERGMRESVTNLFILNLAASDLVVMVVCVPEIVQFMGNRGWLLGVDACAGVRFTQVAALYSSVLTLLAVCVERRRWSQFIHSKLTSQKL